MKVLSKTNYALRTVLDLAMHGDDGVCRVADIAKRQGIPQKFLEQILLAMKAGKIVDSRRGMRGGYYLLEKPTDITLASLVRVIGDSLSQVPEGRLDGDDHGISESALREVWHDISNHITKKLESVTVQDLCDRMKKLSAARAPNYVI